MQVYLASDGNSCTLIVHKNTDLQGVCLLGCVVLEEEVTPTGTDDQIHTSSQLVSPGPTYWVGKQANGSKFVPYWDKVGAVGHYDYGSLTMARTLGSDPNQVCPRACTSTYLSILRLCPLNLFLVLGIILKCQYFQPALSLFFRRLMYSLSLLLFLSLLLSLSLSLSLSLVRSRSFLH